MKAAAVLVAVLAILAPAFAAKPKGKADPKTKTAGPTLLELKPSSWISGMLKVEKIRIIGRGFMRTGNIVRFGPRQLAPLPSPDGSVIEFLPPENPATSAQVAGAEITQQDIKVTVTTDKGTSNALFFTIMER